MTILENRMSTDDHTNDVGFDPLVEFAGMWDQRLARDYGPWLGDKFGKWESVSGRLFVSPYEASNNSWGEHVLTRLLADTARRAGYYVYGCLNIALGPNTWIQPDVCILHRLPSTPYERQFVPVEYLTMAIEFVSPSSRQRDKIDKPRLLAEYGKPPYYMTVDIDAERRTVAIEQAELDIDRYKIISSAITGQTFTLTKPFAASFAVNELLEPES